MITRISLVRHGVTEWNYAGRVQGRTDIPLAPEGERQAEVAADRLAGEPWDAIYSSPLKRAHQTALIIARRVGEHQVHLDARLAERQMGEAEGLSDEDVSLLWPGVPWDHLPGMEPPDALAARAHAALTEIVHRHSGGRVICVAHGALIRHFLRSLGGAAAGARHRNVSITTVCHDGQRFIQEGAPDHRHILLDGVEYSGEKGRVSVLELEALLPGVSSLGSVIWRATAVESASVDDRLVGFARAFTDGVHFGFIDIAVAAPGYERVRSVLIDRLKRRYPHVSFTVI